MLELDIVKPEISGTAGEIQFNERKFYDDLEQHLAGYAKFEVTSDNVGEAKEYRAKLNKLVKTLQDRKKEIKEFYLEPYKRFEEKVVKAVSMVEGPLNRIAAGIKLRENDLDLNKKEAINKLFKCLFLDMPHEIKLEPIFNPKWLNLSYTMEKIEKELQQQLQAFKDHIAIVKDKGKWVQHGLNKLYQCASLGETLVYMDELEKMSVVQEKRDKAKPKLEVVDTQTESELFTVKFSVTATKRQLLELKAFLSINSLKVEKL